MARLMAVGALPEDEPQPRADRPRRDDDDFPGGGVAAPGPSAAAG